MQKPLYLIQLNVNIKLGLGLKIKSLGIATIYHPTQVKNHKKIIKIDKVGYIFDKIVKLTIFTNNSIRKLNPISYKNCIQKPMPMTKTSKLNNRNPDSFKNLECITLFL